MVIPEHTQYPIQPNGFDPIPYPSVSQQNSDSASITVATDDLSASATVQYTNGTSETGLTVVPPLRPFGNAALHVVGKGFLDAITGLTKDRVRRFR